MAKLVSFLPVEWESCEDKYHKVGGLVMTRIFVDSRDSQRHPVQRRAKVSESGSYGSDSGGTAIQRTTHFCENYIL